MTTVCSFASEIKHSLMAKPVLFVYIIKKSFESNDKARRRGEVKYFNFGG